MFKLSAPEMWAEARDYILINSASDRTDAVAASATITQANFVTFANLAGSCPDSIRFD
jgi:hypothetical protein